MSNIDKMRDAINKQDSCFFNKKKAIDDSGLPKEEAIAALEEMESTGEIIL